MWIHYRFRHAVRWEKSIPVTGDSITVGELERTIVALKLSDLERRKKDRRRLAETRILVYDAETGEEYGSDNEKIPANSCIIVHLLTLWSNAFIESKRASQLKTQSSTSIAKEEYKHDSVKRAIRPVRSVWHCLKTPPGYICHRCHVPGHYIQACPTNGDPRYDIEVSKHPTDVSTASSEKDVFSSTVSLSSRSIPMELNCPLCKEVMKEAVLIKCCFSSFCDKCIRDLIISRSACICGATNISVDDLIPNKTLRVTIERFLSSTSDCSENNGSCCLQAQGSEVDHYSKTATMLPSATKPASTKGSVESVAVSGVTDSLNREAAEQFDAPTSELISGGRAAYSSSLGTLNEELQRWRDDNGSGKRVSSNQNVSLIKLWNTCIPFMCSVLLVYFLFPCPEDACILLFQTYLCILCLVTLMFVSGETGGQLRFCVLSSLLNNLQQIGVARETLTSGASGTVGKWVPFLLKVVVYLV